MGLPPVCGPPYARMVWLDQLCMTRVKVCVYVRRTGVGVLPCEGDPAPALITTGLLSHLTLTTHVLQTCPQQPHPVITRHSKNNTHRSSVLGPIFQQSIIKPILHIYVNLPYGWSLITRTSIETVS